mmetsp:Transcript_34337/g.67536  ORF Transcript_34337/g.67536 Transcript_34337/m.67536 type:complete len:281 (+) Transcript_34337:90-932(+)
MLRHALPPGPFPCPYSCISSSKSNPKPSSSASSSAPSPMALSWLTTSLSAMSFAASSDTGTSMSSSMLIGLRLPTSGGATVLGEDAASAVFGVAADGCDPASDSVSMKKSSTAAPDPGDGRVACDAEEGEAAALLGVPAEDGVKRPRDVSRSPRWRASAFLALSRSRSLRRSSFFLDFLSAFCRSEGGASPSLLAGDCAEVESILSRMPGSFDPFFFLCFPSNGGRVPIFLAEVGVVVREPPPPVPPSSSLEFGGVSHRSGCRSAISSRSAISTPPGEFP